METIVRNFYESLSQEQQLDLFNLSCQIQYNRNKFLKSYNKKEQSETKDQSEKYTKAEIDILQKQHAKINALRQSFAKFMKEYYQEEQKGDHNKYILYSTQLQPLQPKKGQICLCSLDPMEQFPGIQDQFHIIKIDIYKNADIILPICNYLNVYTLQNLSGYQQKNRTIEEQKLQFEKYRCMKWNKNRTQFLVFDMHLFQTQMYDQDRKLFIDKFFIDLQNIKASVSLQDLYMIFGNLVQTIREQIVNQQALWSLYNIYDLWTDDFDLQIMNHISKIKERQHFFQYTGISEQIKILKAKFYDLIKEQQSEKAFSENNSIYEEKQEITVENNAKRDDKQSETNGETQEETHGETQDQAQKQPEDKTQNDEQKEENDEQKEDNELQNENQDKHSISSIGDLVNDEFMKKETILVEIMNIIHETQHIYYCQQNYLRYDNEKQGFVSQFLMKTNVKNITNVKWTKDV